jgi:hypothetical protein
MLNFSTDPTNQAFIGFTIAFQPTGGALTDANTRPQAATVNGNSAVVVSLSAVISGLAPGTYQVGLAAAPVGTGGTPGASALTLTGATSALVFRS